MPVRESNPRSFLIVLAMLAAFSALIARAAVPAAPAPSGFRYWDTRDTAAIPKTLSALGLYAVTPGKNAALIPQALRYEVNVPQWSDGARKRHWVILKTGRHIAFTEKDDYWGYPDSAVFVEELSIDTIPGDSSSRVLWETRVLFNKIDSLDPNSIGGWHGVSYKWRKNQQDADRVDLIHGKDDSIPVWPNGTGSGKSRAIKKWHFPTIYQCWVCHRTNTADTVHERSVLGFFTAQLNRPAPDSAGLNQLDWFFSKGILAGSKPAAWNDSPHWRGIEDSGASVDLRARSYIAANCSGCHGRRGISAGAAMGVMDNFDFHDMQAAMEFRNRATGWGFGLDTVPPLYYKPNDAANVTHGDSEPIVPALIVPGYPEKSVLIFREKSRNTTPGDYDLIYMQMPPLATFEVNNPAVALLERWVREMGGSTTAVGRSKRLSAGESIRLRGRFLTLVPDDGGSGLDGYRGNREVTLVSLDGRQVALRRLSAGKYEVPAGLPKGLYYIRAGARSVLRALF
ncbi:MAG: hypothetical protein JF616_09585 [Fibrobacteres bacterium]|nr:hypothetical protein [Fibrobacterota bacterium]